MSAEAVYDARGFGGRQGSGKHPAVVVVDFIEGFTNPGSQLACDADNAIAATRRLLDLARARGLPVFFTTVSYTDDDLGKAAMFIAKAPALATLRPGSHWAEVDQRLGRSSAEPLLVKLFASGFYGTTLDNDLRLAGCDTVLVVGASTSGCVRATAVDALQHGYRVVVPRDCVADRAAEAHHASLLDIDAKYGDVVSIDEAIAALAGAETGERQVREESVGSLVGARTNRIDGERLLTGKGRYIDDLDLPATAHMAVLRSPHAHARIVGVDLTAARRDPRCLTAMEGREALLHADPIPHLVDPTAFGGKHADVRVLAVDKVVFAGQPVAAVVASTPGDARDLLRLIDTTYEPLPAVVDADDALASDSPLLYDDQGWEDNLVARISFEHGDFDAAAAGAPLVLEDEFLIQRYSSQPIETRGYVADWDATTGGYTFYAAAQNPHPLRWSLGRTLRASEADIHVVVGDLGGAFGLKMHGHPEEALTCIFSRALGRPVKWIEERDETLLIGAREQRHRFEVAFDGDGVIHALRNHVVANIGAVSACPGWMMAALTGLVFPTGYRIPVTHVTVDVATSNKGPWNAARGFGKEATQVIMERVLDLVAEATGLDPAEVRSRNYIPKDAFPYRTNASLVIDSGDYHLAQDKVLRLLDYTGFRERQTTERRAGRYPGFGIAFELTPESGGGMPGRFIGGYDTATVRMSPSGAVTVLSGVTTPGGGNDTGIAQIVAQTLGVGLEDVEVVQGDTRACPFGFGNYSGRSMVVGGSAAYLAANDLRAKLASVAAELLGESADDLVFANGTVTSSLSGSRLAVSEIAYAIATVEVPAAAAALPLEATRVYLPQNIQHIRDEKGLIQRYATYSYAVHAAIVDVDVETGKVTLERYGVVHDCGTMINPALVEGQMRGAVTMGIGAALTEEQRYTEDGELLSDGFKSYLLPRASDLPEIEIEHQVITSPFTPLGVKGAGEAGVGGAQAAIVNAVNDAISPLGARLRRTPASAPNVLASIVEARVAV